MTNTLAYYSQELNGGRKKLYNVGQSEIWELDMNVANPLWREKQGKLQTGIDLKKNLFF
jgi:hypothetical protein